MSKNDFIKNIAEIVVKENEKRGYPLFSSVVIAQACLETGYGNSSLMMKANAVFGIKATKNWKGLVYNAKTKECYNGINFVNINDCFRAYLSLVDSVADYFDLITKSERYRKACTAETAFECITAIKNGGYATDPNYVEKIMNIIRNNDLIAKYDEKIDVVESNIDELVQKTLKGEFGNGEERKKNLGSYYNIVQSKINSLYGKTVKKDLIYYVKKGDTLSSIAKKFNTTYTKIAKDNNINDPNLIYPNQKLIIKN